MERGMQMTKQTNREKVVDLTSLLDVVLILLFGLLVTMSMETEEAQSEINALQNDLFQERMNVEYLMDEQEILTGQISEIIESEDPIKRLEQLEFISEQFYVIEVRVDSESGHEVVINEERTRIFLPLSIRNDQEALEQVKLELFDTIEELIAENNTEANYTLLSLEDRGGTYNFAFDLLWNVFRDIEEKESATKIHKMQYIHY